MKLDPNVRELILDATEGEGKATFVMAPLVKVPAGVPPIWKKALTDANPRTAVLDLLWKPLAKKYPKTLRVLRRTLQNVGLLSTPKGGHSLVYLFVFDDGDPILWRGYPPAKKLPKVASRLPADYLALYAVHDGWLDEWGQMGPRRSADWRPLGESGPSRDLLITFEGHGPGNLGFDLSEPSAPCYVVWTDSAPKRVRKIAAEIDDWIVAQMEELAPAKPAARAPVNVVKNAKPRARAKRKVSSK